MGIGAGQSSYAACFFGVLGFGFGLALATPGASMVARSTRGSPYLSVSAPLGHLLETGWLRLPLLESASVHFGACLAESDPLGYWAGWAGNPHQDFWAVSLLGLSSKPGSGSFLVWWVEG